MSFLILVVRFVIRWYSSRIRFRIKSQIQLQIDEVRQTLDLGCSRDGYLAFAGRLFELSSTYAEEERNRLNAAGVILTGKNEKLEKEVERLTAELANVVSCLLYTSPSPRDRTRSRMPSSA